MDQKKIGNFLRELRNEKGITQEQAANEFGVAQRTVSCWETGSINDADLCAYFTIIFGTISIPLVFTIYWWIVPVFLSFGTGYMAIKNKSEKTRYAIAGIVLSVVAVIFAIIYIAAGI